MPKVSVVMHPRFLKEIKRMTKEGKAMKELIKNLPTIIAENLSVPGTKGELTPQEVEVEVRTIGPLDITNGKELMINVVANKYPERLENLDHRRFCIRNRVLELAPTSVVMKSYVWVHLSDASYDEF